jgi:hypothetical protein
MTIDISEHYRAVLEDLLSRREIILEELQQLDAAIGTIRRQVSVAPAQLRLRDEAPMVSLTSSPQAPNYAHMSVRWATLWNLSELDTEGAKKTAEVAQALRDGGYRTTMGDKFGNSVSAVLSVMKGKGEVETVEDGAYRITPAGREVWEHIKKSERFRQTQQPT